MKQFGKIMLIVLGLSAFAAGLSSVPTRPAAAAGGAPVFVQNFPATQNVSGTVSVNNFPATQNVEITGTPTVNASVNFPSSFGVTNTIATPLFVVDPSRSAAQHVELVCLGGTLQLCAEGSTTPYTVPTGQNLVVTSIDIDTISLSNGAGTVGFGFARPSPISTSILAEWIVPNDGLTHSFQYPSGYVFPAGYTFSATNGVGLSTGFGGPVFLEGYLTVN